MKLFPENKMDFVASSELLDLLIALISLYVLNILYGFGFLFSFIAAWLSLYLMRLGTKHYKIEAALEKHNKAIEGMFEMLKTHNKLSEEDHDAIQRRIDDWGFDRSKGHGDMAGNG